MGFAVALEDFLNGCARRALNLMIGIEEWQAKFHGEALADG